MVSLFDLAYPIDDTVEIDGITYKIDMSFDNILRLYDMLNDKELDDITQVVTGLEMLLGVCFICDYETQYEIFERIFKEYIAVGEEDSQPLDIDGNPMPMASTGKSKKTYDLKQDAEYIYASFMSDYQIDLFEQQGKMHWYKFNALLGGLTDDSKFMRVIEIRTMDLPKGKGTEKERERIKELKRHYALKGDDIYDEFEDDTM